MEYICRDPRAMVRAANVHATLDAFNLLPMLGQRIVEKHSLPTRDLTPDNWVPVQRWLDALHEIQTHVGPTLVRQVGTRIIENADFPPQFGTVEAILMALDDIYQLNHRGDVGHYRIEKLFDGGLRIRCETPYPREFEHGLVEGICRNKAAGGRRFAIEYLDGPPGGDLTCTLVVRPRDGTAPARPSPHPPRR